MILSIPDGLWWWYGQFQMGYGGGMVSCKWVMVVVWSLMTSDLVNSKPIIWCWFWGVCRMMVDNLDVYNVQCCEVVHFYWVY